jgi:hypothetical protein
MVQVLSRLLVLNCLVPQPCISCKLMEHIINSHIMKHADTHNILYPLQHGFRKGLSCETQAFWNWLLRMFAFSTGSECRSPSDFNGGICLPSDLLCLMKVQNRFIVLPLFSDWENIKEDLKSIQNTVNTMKEMNHPINSIWDHFKTSLDESIKRNVPIKTTRKKDGCPWITSSRLGGFLFAFCISDL